VASNGRKNWDLKKNPGFENPLTRDMLYTRVVEQFFTKDYHGAPFVLFGPAHLASLAVVLLFNLSFILVRRSPDQRLRQVLRVGMAIWLVLNELSWHVWNWAIGDWNVQTMLPLQLCNVFVFLSAWMLLTRSRKIYELAYFLGIGGAIQPLITPDAGMYGFPHFRFIQPVISHGLIISAVVYLTVVEGFRPTWKSIGRSVVAGNLYLLVIGLVVNPLLGSNYLMTAYKPDVTSLLTLLAPWPWYILEYEGVGLVTFLILYLPFAVLDWRRDARAARSYS
jgi:hypothetical integral membrane protein (TIGR02206 family)